MADQSNPAIYASLAEMLRGLGLPVHSLRGENFKEKKGVWWVDAGDGAVYILKKLTVSRDRLGFLLAAVDHLRKHGVLIPAPVPLPASGLPYFANDGAFYVLSEAVDGRAPLYDVPEELEFIARALAGFHAASRGFVPPADGKERTHLGRWPEDYRQKRERLSAYASRAAGEASAFARQASSAIPRFIELAARAEEELARSGYASWCEAVAREPILCHQDFAAGNLAVAVQPIAGATSAPIWIFDTDSITIDLPVRDLRKILNKALKKGDTWDSGKARAFLDSYRRVFPLTADQLEVLRVDLGFPHLFYGIVSKYFEGRENEWDESKFRKKLAQVIAFEASKEQSLGVLMAERGLVQ